MASNGTASNILSLGFMPPGLRIPFFAASGALCGFTIAFAVLFRAFSYISAKPEVCINCHVMMPEYSAHAHGSHANAATCIDCHIPQRNIIQMIWNKAQSGAGHTAAYLTHREPQVIGLSARSKQTVQDNCLRCHAGTVENVRMLSSTDRTCSDCHRDNVHSKVRGLATAPNALRGGK